MGPDLIGLASLEEETPEREPPAPLSSQEQAEERSCGDTVRRWPPTSQEETPPPETAMLDSDLELPTSRTRNKYIFVVYAHTPMVFKDGSSS